MFKLEKLLTVAIACSFTPSLIHAQSAAETRDSLATVRLGEVVVTSPSRETNAERSLPTARTYINPTVLEQSGFRNVRDLSAIVPNLHIPEYGSAASSAFYIRGVGSRYGGQSIGVYVDGVPQMNRNGLLFSTPMIHSIEVLRGPQGTLYGRNALGGIINVRTYSPFDRRLEQYSITGGYPGLFAFQTATSFVYNPRVAHSIATKGSFRKGYWTNSVTGKPADSEKDLSILLKVGWHPNVIDNLSFQLYGNWVDQGAFPYRPYNAEKDVMEPLALNAPSNYERGIASMRLLWLRQREQTSFNLALSGEYLTDKMQMDQDYSPRDLFTVQQRQKAFATTAEALFKWHSKDNRHQLSTGAFAYYKGVDLNSPITFGIDALKGMFAPQFNKLNDKLPMPARLVLRTDAPQGVDLSFKKPELGGSIYAQYALNDLFTLRGLTLTLGMHLGIDRLALDYDTGMALSFDLVDKDGNKKPFSAPTQLNGKLHKTFVQGSPKVALQYSCTPNVTTYFSYSQGYKAGGYNEQAFAEVLQGRQVTDIVSALMHKPAAPQPDLSERLSYKPERSNNLELGFNSLLFNKRLQFDVALFATRTSDLQLTDFVASGLGRQQTNYGTGKYLGAEVSLVYKPISSLLLAADYGYTHARLRIPERESNPAYEVKIPYVPAHTLSLRANYTHRLKPSAFISSWSIGADLNGTGSIYWSTKEDLKEPFNVVLGAQASVTKGHFTLSACIRNITNNERRAFLFSSLGRNLFQSIAPRRIECTLTYTPWK